MVTYDEALSAAKLRHGESELTDEQARAFCAAWADPGPAGWAIAAVAKGAWSPASLLDPNWPAMVGKPEEGMRGEAFRDCLWRTFRIAQRRLAAMTEFVATVERAERLPNSVDGNLRYRVIFQDHESAPTARDSIVAYAVTIYLGQRVTVTLDEHGNITNLEPQ